jgi:2-methylisocitrate lyase-like PEP mutase family enzyme
MTLRDLLVGGEMIVAPGVYDGLSAALVREAGFPAAYLSGAAVSASAVGVPDLGLATMNEIVAAAVVANRQLDVPLIADADTGFGDVTNVVRTVREYARAGVAAIQLEDQVFPKRCGHLDGKEVVETLEFAEKLMAAAEARDDDVLLVARTDAVAVNGLGDALARAETYAEAGADLVFVEAPRTLEEVAAIPSRVPVPAVFNLVPGGRTPPVELEQLREWGYAVVIAPGACVAPAQAAIREGLNRLRSGQIDAPGGASPRSLFDTVGLEHWEALRRRHAIHLNEQKERLRAG